MFEISHQETHTVTRHISTKKLVENEKIESAYIVDIKTQTEGLYKVFSLLQCAWIGGMLRGSQFYSPILQIHPNL